jgi:hypothetical protein
MLDEAARHYAILIAVAPQSKEAVFAQRMLSVIQNQRSAR